MNSPLHSSSETTISEVTGTISSTLWSTTMPRAERPSERFATIMEGFTGKLWTQKSCSNLQALSEQLL